MQPDQYKKVSREFKTKLFEYMVIIQEINLIYTLATAVLSHIREV